MREGDRVRKAYLGAGPAAVQASRESERKRQAASASQEAIAKAEADIAPLDTMMDGLDTVADHLARVAVLAGGCHEHHGQWRRKRGTT